MRRLAATALSLLLMLAGIAASLFQLPTATEPGLPWAASACAAWGAHSLLIARRAPSLLRLSCSLSALAAAAMSSAAWRCHLLPQTVGLAVAAVLFMAVASLPRSGFEPLH